MNGGVHLEEVLQVQDLRVWYPVKRQFSLWDSKTTLFLRAVDGVSFSIRTGNVLGIVGESGCGKSTLARAIVRLETPTAGSIVFKGEDIAAIPPKNLRQLRTKIQMIFQDPYASLNPRMTVFDTLAEPIYVHRKLRGQALAREVYQLMDKVGLAQRYVRKYPHEFSGGQRQRIAIARALSLRPKLLVADEPVSALDVSVQAQIINLLETLQHEDLLTMMFISHDLGVVRHLAQDIAVMYLGRIVETGPSEAIFNSPLHPYTRMLLDAVPIPDPDQECYRKRTTARGEPPSPLHPPTGCVFHPRCPIARPECSIAVPILQRYKEDHAAACPFGELR